MSDLQMLTVARENTSGKRRGVFWPKSSRRHEGNEYGAAAAFHAVPASTRNDAVVYFEHRLDLHQTLDYLDRWNDGPARPRLILFHLLMTALARTLHERPRMNRFVAGRRIYQRNAVEISCWWSRR